MRQERRAILFSDVAIAAPSSFESPTLNSKAVERLLGLGWRVGESSRRQQPRDINPIDSAVWKFNETGQNVDVDEAVALRY
jgi:hypothetical protein